MFAASAVTSYTPIRDTHAQSLLPHSSKSPRFAGRTMFPRPQPAWFSKWIILALLVGCNRAPKQPVAQSQAELSLNHGRETYQRMCSVCHGAVGEGYKADQAPRLRGANFLATASDSFLTTVITHGRDDTTMSAWGNERGGPLSPSDVSAVIQYLRSFSKEKPRVDPRPSLGDKLRGAEIYTRECTSCHGPTGNGGPAPHIGDSSFLATANDGFLRIAITEGRAQTPMPAFKRKLDPKSIEDVIALLRSRQVAVVSPSVPVKPPPLPLGPVLIHPNGPEPYGFKRFPETTGVDIVKRELDRGAQMGFLDARAPSDYMREHIAGAVSVPFYDPAPYIDKLPKTAWLVCYCACPHAESGKLAQQLLDKGFTKVTVLDEGLGVWKSKKFPTSTGANL